MTMKTTRRLLWLVAVLPFTLGADDVPRVPQTPAPVDKLVYARAFTLEKGYEYEWRKEKPQVTEGVILVLQVQPALVYPRQCAEPVLYVGEQTAERVNVGHESGHVICIVPGKVDLKTALMWFGTPQLPEQVDAATIKKQRELAEKADIKPFAEEQIKQASERGAKKLEAADRDELRRSLAPLVRQYSSAEKDLADGLEKIPPPSK